MWSPLQISGLTDFFNKITATNKCKIANLKIESAAYKYRIEPMALIAWNYQDNAQCGFLESMVGYFPCCYNKSLS